MRPDSRRKSGVTPARRSPAPDRPRLELQQGAALAGELGTALAWACQDVEQRHGCSGFAAVAGCLSAERVQYRIRVQLEQSRQEVVLAARVIPRSATAAGGKSLRFSVTSTSARPATAAASTCRSFGWLVMEPMSSS